MAGLAHAVPAHGIARRYSRWPIREWIYRRAICVAGSVGVAACVAPDGRRCVGGSGDCVCAADPLNLAGIIFPGRAFRPFQATISSSATATLSAQGHSAMRLMTICRRSHFRAHCRSPPDRTISLSPSLSRVRRGCGQARKQVRGGRCTGVNQRSILPLSQLKERGALIVRHAHQGSERG